MRDYPIIPCTLCGNQEGLQRAQIKAMLREWEKKHPGRSDNMLRAMGQLTPSHLLDRNLHPFATLQPTGLADPMGDKAFDEDDACGTTPNAQSVMLMPRGEPAP